MITVNYPLFEVMHKHSKAYAEIINLINIVEHHRTTCDGYCSASTYLVKRTIDRLLKHVWQQEKQDIILKITGVSWT